MLRPGSGLWSHWRRFALLGLLGVGCYNALQYLALKTSTPLNVTLVAASSPVWMLGIGALFFGQRVSRRQLAGAVLSIAGVLVVLGRGEWQLLMQVQLVPGDVYILLATAAWAFYSWLLIRPGDPPAIRGDWAAFLMAQMVMGLGWSGLFAAGEWALVDARIQWGWPLAAALAYVAVGPAILAYRCWGVGRAAGRARPSPASSPTSRPVRRPDVGRLPGRTAPAVPRDRLRADRGRHRGVVAAVAAPRMRFCACLNC